MRRPLRTAIELALLSAEYLGLFSQAQHQIPVLPAMKIGSAPHPHPEHQHAAAPKAPASNPEAHATPPVAPRGTGARVNVRA